MIKTIPIPSLIAIALIAGCASDAVRDQEMAKQMSFFVTSAGSGKGADLGGLAGADAHCQKLAAGAGGGAKTWRAYLSTSSVAAQAPALPVPAVNARDRIGKGPWFNVKGVMVARDLGQLHDDSTNLTKATALTEKGEGINGVGDNPNAHDILTGSRPDGTAFRPIPNLTCGNWTASGDGSAMVGHHDRRGLVTDPWALSWNSSHQTNGCSQDQLRATGGAGLFYCFATN